MVWYWDLFCQLSFCCPSLPIRYTCHDTCIHFFITYLNRISSDVICYIVWYVLNLIYMYTIFSMVWVNKLKLNLNLFNNCGIIKVCGGSIFVVFERSPIPRIYIIHEKQILKRLVFLLKLKIEASTKWHPHEYKQTNTHNPRKLVPINLNDSTVFNTLSL